MREATTLSVFGHDFQTKIFKCMIQDKVYGSSIIQMLKISYFTQQKFRILFNKLKQYHSQYHALPNYITLRVIANSLQDKDQIPNILDLINKMQQQHSPDQMNFIKKESLTFCRNQQMRNAIIDSVDLLGSGDMQGIWQRFNKVLKVTMDGDMGLDMNTSYDYVMLRQNRLAISTGYQLLDKEFDGGIGKGQLAVVMAPTGGGKSQFLVNIRKGRLLQGKVVVYISMQLSEQVVAARMASLLSGVKINSMNQKKDQVISAIKYFYEKTNSKFIVKQYPTKSIGVTTLKSYMHKLRANGIIPNMLILDYADLIKPQRNSKQKRTELQDIYESLRQLAGVQNIPLWTATQTNRSALQEEVIGAGMIAESFGKMFVSDQVISISRTTQDKIAGTGKLHVIKNRNGQQGTTFSLSVACQRCLFCIDRKLGRDQHGQDTNRMLQDFKSQRQKKAGDKMQMELRKFLDKDKK